MKYAYEGPVMMFDSCVCSKWKSETIAESEAKAKSNLAYQYKRQRHLSPSTNVRLTGKLKQLG